MSTKTYKVLYDFHAEEEGEMTVKSGDIVIYDPDEGDGDDSKNGWIFVQSSRSSDCGYVPLDYLELYNNNTVKAPPPSQTIKSPPDFGTPIVASSTPETKTKMSLASLMKMGTVNDSPQTNNKSESISKSQVNISQPPPPPSFAQSALGAKPPLNLSNITSKLSLPQSAASPSTLNVSTAGFSSSNADFSSSTNKKSTGKLKSAATTVQNMVKVTNIVAAPRVPSLSAAVEREDFEEMVKRNDEYFARLLSSQADTFDSLTDMVDSLSKKLMESTQCANDLVSRLSELDDLIDEEKRKWKQQYEAEKNANILGRSKELTKSEFQASH